MPSALRKQVHAQIGHSLKKSGVFILEAYSGRYLFQINWCAPDISPTPKNYVTNATYQDQGPLVFPLGVGMQVEELQGT